MVGQTQQTTQRYSCTIATSDPTSGTIEALLPGQLKPVMVRSTPVAFRWPIAGETWWIENINGTFCLLAPVPIQDLGSTDATTAQNDDVTTINDVNPGDVVLNSPTGKVWILGDNTGANDWSFTEASFNAPRAPDGPAGGDLGGTFPNPSLSIPCGKVVRLTSGLQAITTGVGAEIVWDTTVFTKHGMVTGAGGFTVPVTGVYDVSAQVLMNADTGSTTGRLDVAVSNVTVNGPLASSGWDAGGILLWWNGTFASLNVRTLIPCSAGDRVNAGIFNRDSITHNVYGAGAGNPWTQMSISLVTR